MDIDEKYAHFVKRASFFNLTGQREGEIGVSMKKSRRPLARAE